MAERQALLLLCGIGEDEAVWAPLMSRLDGIANCRPMVATGDSIDAMAVDILARAEGRVAVAGHSLGGYVAMAAQRAAPARVARLALLNSSALPDDAATRQNRRRLIARAARDGFPTMVRAMVPALVAAQDRAATSDAEAMLLRTGEERFAREQRAAMTRPDARQALAAINIPVLVIGAARDQVVAPARSHEIAAAVAGATLVMLPDAGHLAPIEAPGAIAAAMRAWLAR